MELWERMTGWISLEMTSADPERSLRRLTDAGLRLQQVLRKSELLLVFRIRRTDLAAVSKICSKNGDQLRVLGIHGAYYKIKAWRRHPVLLAAVFFVILATWFLPSRVLFIQVQGNESVATNLILETAAEFGVHFGASRRDVRSERVKNELLGAMPELEWVGVNTSGCVATITVRERDPEPEETTAAPGNVVASCDGVIESITLVRGNLLCQVGQAVRAGQVLVSGYSDLGICTHIMEAEAEVYALTAHEITAVLPQQTLVRGQQQEQIKKYSLIFGKNRINLYSSSGILLPTYGKMTQVKELTLPGGLVLPVRLVIETYTGSELTAADREETQAAAVLAERAESTLRGHMLAGQITAKITALSLEQGVWRFTGRYGCREMIARQQSGVFIEGDAKDDGETG